MIGLLVLPFMGRTCVKATHGALHSLTPERDSRSASARERYHLTRLEYLLLSYPWGKPCLSPLRTQLRNSRPPRHPLHQPFTRLHPLQQQQ